MASGLARIVLAGFAFLPPAVWTPFNGAAVVFMLAFRFLAIAEMLLYVAVTVEL